MPAGVMTMKIRAEPNRIGRLFRTFFYGLMLAVFWPLLSQAETLVRVGGYEFQPFVVTGSQEGMTHALIEFLNREQGDYRFEFVPTTPNGRYADLRQKKFDVMFFEMSVWGWERQDIAVETTQPLITDYEVFFALNTAEGKRMTANAVNHNLAALAGYHYKFAGFNSDPDYLHSNFQIQLLDTAAEVLDRVRKGEAEVGTLTISYLRKALKLGAPETQEIYISNFGDQIYRLPILLPKGGVMSLADMEKILSEIHESGRLRQFFASHKIVDLYAYRK